MSETIRHHWEPWTPRGQIETRLTGPGGRMLRLNASTPEGAAPPGGWPCLILLDGDRFFAAAAGTATALAQRAEKTGVAPMVVVGLSHLPQGEPLEDQRARDFTSTPCPEAGPRPSGEASAFRAFLAESVIPAIQAEIAVDRERLALFGHSLAGLFVLETLETAPDPFARWIAVSPSLWWRTPVPAVATRALLTGCGEMETAREMRSRIEAWAVAAGAPCLVAARADHGSAAFALMPDVLRWASGPAA